MTGHPAAADRSLPRKGCQAGSRATLCPEVPHPPCAAQGRKSSLTAVCLESYAECSRWGHRGIEWQNHLAMVTELGFTPRSVRSQQPVV